MFLTLVSLIICCIPLSFEASPQNSTHSQALPRNLFGSSFGIPGTNATYDYVIIGGGTAGLTVAKRLSEDPTISVAVIEAGSFYEIGNGNLSQVPLFYSRYTQEDPAGIQPLVDWGIMTTPQPQLNGRSLHIAQGKCLGGGSARNQMIYHRGTIGAYQLLADTVSDQSYTFPSLLPHFKKSITFTPPTTNLRRPNSTASFLPSAYSPTGGPLHVSFPNYAYPFSSWGAIALTSIGITERPDFSSGTMIGSGYVPFTIDPEDETRSSSETSFLREALGEDGLTVYQSAQALKILFDGAKSAWGVNVSTGGMAYVISARKEVILSAGVFHSPQLLMVSGIGPVETLQRFDIPIISNLSGVGQNMKDSCRVGAVTHPINMNTVSIASLAKDTLLRDTLTEEFLVNKTGPLTNPGGDYIGWEKIPPPLRTTLTPTALSSLSQFPSDWPEVEYLISSTATVTANGTINTGTMGFSLTAALSKGNITIQSNSMLDPPLVSPNWMLDPTDQEVAIRGIRRLREAWGVIAEGITVGDEISPGANVTTDEELLAWIRNSVAAVHHGTATCAMGKTGDPQAVVDSHGKVFGVSNLRVIDGSSLPFTPPGHTQGAIYAHAEKLVDDIKKGL